MHVKIKATHFERNGDCKSTEVVEECYKDCFELAGPGSSGCIGGEITNKASNDSECLEKVKWLTDDITE